MYRGKPPVFPAILAVAIFAATCACVAAEMEPSRHDESGETFKILVDTDMGLDDVRALFALLTDTLIDVRGIITVEGSASAGRGTDNLIGLVESIHREDVPVYRGYHSPGLKPPAWRNTANRLGGAAFPPPREKSPLRGSPNTLDSLLGKCGPGLHYLALGPLGNLAQLESTHPGSLERIETIWIPVKKTGEHGIASWNLSCDPRSTEEVFSRASSIVLIDIGPARNINPAEALGSVEGSTCAARWIKNTFSHREELGAHLFIHDDLAAAALIQSGLIRLEDVSYNIKISSDGNMEIHPSAWGHIEVATLQDPEKAVELLHSLWESGSHVHQLHQAEHSHDEHITPAELLKSFHGHLGPYVVLGYRMGKMALEAAGSQGHFDISALVYSALKVPKSCLIDGVQIGSGCTLGKRNIEVRDFEGPAYAIFETAGGRRIRIGLRPEVPGLVDRLVENLGVEAAGKEILEMDPDTLLEIKIPY